MFQGERGKSGDHGQAGADGRQGERGQRGLPGPASYDQFEEHVATVTGQSLAAHEKQLKWSDRRIAALALFLVFAVIFTSYVDERGEDRFTREQEQTNQRIELLTNELVMVCNENVAGHRRQNAILDEQIATIQSSPVRTPEEKAEITRTYQGLKQPISKCPPLG